LDEDTRLVPILNNLSQGFLAGIASEWASASGSGTGDDIKAEMVDGLARKHFPMCMRALHDNLQRDSHLKYFGRLQYGLFLKVCFTDICCKIYLQTFASQVLGLSIEEAIIFWRKSFSNGTTDDEFNKKYKYNIRHSYGLEGRRHNYPAKRYDVSILQNDPC
jgi:DNA primase large subunit